VVSETTENSSGIPQSRNAPRNIPKQTKYPQGKYTKGRNICRENSPKEQADLRRIYLRTNNV
jgi:hypothetical protein